jgi:hypothetical protein
MTDWMFCRQDDAVLKAARSGEWSPELRAHAASCAACQDTLLLSASLQALVPSSQEGPLPEPGLILRKAQLLQRLQVRGDDLERVTRPVTLATAMSLAGAGALLAWSGWWAAAPLLAVLALAGGLRVVWEAE